MKMISTRKRSGDKFVRTAIAAVVASSFSSGAFAQDQQAEASETADTVTVTGSRIAKRDAVAESPIFTVEQDTITNSGYVTVDQYLNTLPQIVPNISSQSNNPSSGGRAFVDLRGLGPERNLVLIDGRRVIGQASGGTIVDANAIPAALIERVEIITGGAAATYGPDAIAGVVNFIMKKSFDGFEIDGQYRETEKGDGLEKGMSMTFGETFANGRGSAVFNASYFTRDAMYKDARAFAAQASSTTGIFPGGSWSTGTNTPSQAAVDQLFGAGLCNANGGQAGFGFNPDGSLFCTGVQGNPDRNAVNYTGPDSFIATAFYPDLFSYNFEPDNILVLPLDRWNIYSNVELDLGAHFKPYAQATFTNYNSLQELAPTPASGFSIPVGNVFVPSELAALLATRDNPDANFSFNKRFNDIGGRTGYNTHDVWQLTTGVRGDIVSSWQYDVHFSWGRSVRNEIQGGNIRLNRVNELLAASDGGASVCEGGLNLFGAAPISASCAAYISLQAKNLTVVEQGIVEGVVSGSLFELPAGDVQAAFGASYRNLDFDFLPDSGLQPGLVAGFNEQLPVSGRLDYTDVFAEVSLPIVAGLTGIQSLSTTIGLRTTDNNIFGRDESWKITLDWAINDQVRARGGFQHAIRSPNIAELFTPQTNNFPTFTNQDPCNTTGANATNPEFGRNGANGAQVQALCAAQSAVAGGDSYVQPFGQARGITGGNPNLKPEKADSWTLGLVASPQFESPLLQRFSFSVDYFTIEIEDVIGAIGAATIVQRCFNRDGANPNYDPGNAWCQFFVRDQADGGVVQLQQLQLNQAVFEVSGIDLTTNWGLGVGPGQLDFNFLLSWLQKFDQKTAVTPNDPTYDYAGTIGSTTGTSAPEWKGTLVTSYSWDALRLQATTRYISSMDHANTVTGGSPVTNTGVDATWYLDLAASYNLFHNLTLRAGVNNVANQSPRLYSPNVQANTDPSLYDVLGRRYFVGFNWQI